MEDLEHLSNSKKKIHKLPNGNEWLAQYNHEKGLTECSECHNKYDWQTMANEPFRVIMDDDATIQKKVCVDCYFKWVGSDDDKTLSRYCGSIEETEEGICYIDRKSVV